MSRVKVKEDLIGPLVPGGPQFICQTWHDYLCPEDTEPLAIEHEIPFSNFTSFIENELRAVGCWRRDSDKCWRFSSKIKNVVVDILHEALVGIQTSPDEVSEASSPVQQLHVTTPTKPKEAPKRAYQDTPDTFRNPLMEDLGNGVKIIYLLDGRVGLEGTLLKNTVPMLQAILHFLPLGPSLGALSCSYGSSDAPRWISSWPLTLAERFFIVKVIKHRIPALLSNEDQLVTIPQEAEPVPARFRPHTTCGKPLNGPYISWNSKKPYNVGRQYFSTFNKNDSDGFLWADGTTCLSIQSKERAEHYVEKQKEREKQQGMLQLVGEFDLLDPAEVLQEEGSGEWDGEMCAGMLKVEYEVTTKRQRCG